MLNLGFILRYFVNRAPDVLFDEKALCYLRCTRTNTHSKNSEE